MLVTFRSTGVHASHVMADARAGGAQVIVLLYEYKYSICIALFDPIYTTCMYVYGRRFYVTLRCQPAVC